MKNTNLTEKISTENSSDVFSFANLNPQQIDAVEYIGSPLLVVAGAGTGKTSVITSKIAYLVSRGYSPNRILAVTFTKKAAEEMRNRVIKLVKVQNNTFTWISTFHSFGVKFLKEEHYLAGRNKNFSIYDEIDSTNCIKIILKNLSDSIKKGDTQNIPVTIPESIIKHLTTENGKDFVCRLLNKLSPADYHRLISLSKQKLDPDSAVEYIAKYNNAFFLPVVYKIYQDELIKSNAFDFDDIILHTLNILLKNNDIKQKWQNRFDYIMIDEFQDTNEPQAKIVDCIASKHKKITVVGDPQQSIYGFRGATPENILAFTDKYNPKIVKLETNYRSAYNILDVANRVLDDTPEVWKPYTLSLKAPSKQKGLIIVNKYDNAYLEYTSIAEKIKLLVSSEVIDYSDIVILIRARYLIQYIENTLIYNQIPYVIIGGMSLLQRAEIKNLLAYLKFFFNPSDLMSFMRIINTPERHVGGKTVEKIMKIWNDGSSLIDTVSLYIKNSKISKKTMEGLKNFLSLYKLYLTIQHIPPREILEHIMTAINYTNYLVKHYSEQEEFYSQIGNIKHLFRIMSSYETLESFLSDLSTIETTSEEKNAVKVMTIHNAKGLEFPIVFLPAIEEGIIPSLSSLKSNEVDEERRLFYVAITRAKMMVYASYTKNRQLEFIKNTRASRFVKYF